MTAAVPKRGGLPIVRTVYSIEQGYPPKTVIIAKTRARRRIRIVESGQVGKPQKRQFVEYRLARQRQGDGFVVVDVFDEFNPILDEYERKREETSIEVPAVDEYERKREETSIEVPADMGERFVRACSDIRRELDQFGLKIFFDPADRDGQVRPKWRYKLRGCMRTDFADVVPSDQEDPYEGDPDVVPEEIVDIVRSDREYYRSNIWKIWFGRKLQRKREDIVYREALKSIRHNI
jgi:hypothetical protein